MLIETVEKTIRKFGMLKDNDRVVVAVSGGPDSVALAFCLNRLKNKWRLYLHLAHLNHLLRADESDQDCAFVKKLARRLGLALTCEKIDVKEYAKEKKLSLEEAARELRYQFLLKVARQNNASKIALGHNRDDQAETVLMRFLRGSGIGGLRAIPAKRKINGCTIIRPLIELWRPEILKFLSARKINYRIDSSNLKDLYLRNKIRNQLLPVLEKDFNPNVKKILVNFAENVSCDFDYLKQCANDKFRALCLKKDAQQIVINLKKFFALHKALQRLVARSAIKELKGNVRRIDYRHWKELEDLAEERPGNSIVDLPQDISIVKKGESLVFYKR